MLTLPAEIQCVTGTASRWPSEREDPGLIDGPAGEVLDLDEFFVRVAAADTTDELELVQAQITDPGLQRQLGEAGSLERRQRLLALLELRRVAITRRDAAAAARLAEAAGELERLTPLFVRAVADCDRLRRDAKDMRRANKLLQDIVAVRQPAPAEVVVEDPLGAALAGDD